MSFYQLQTSTHEANGDKSNKLLGNCHVGEMNFFRAFRSIKNGLQENKTSKLLTLVGTWPMVRDVKIEPDSSGAIRSLEL